MKAMLFISKLLFVLLLSTASTLAARAAEWMLRREGSSAICHVQKVSASPLGSDLAGPLESRKAACLVAKDRFDEEGTNTGKCAGYGGGTVSGCKSDGVELPN